ncbi:MAG: response regulator [Candidatus Omnitrophica bacterium]|nr:response regulator [Candidatus Omnitrophota bacterium]
MNVLVVDNEIEVVNFFSIFLKRLGLNVEKATCGQEALELFNRHKPEWVFLDIKMPDINGLDLLRKMKEINIGIKAIMISGRDDNSNQNEARALGASDYLIKPIDLDEMDRIIKKYIPGQEQN